MMAISDPHEFAAEDTDVLERALREGRVRVGTSQSGPSIEGSIPTARIHSLCERGLLCSLSSREETSTSIVVTTYVATQWGEIAFEAERRRRAVARWRGGERAARR
jgi:hypothetical protein